SGATAAASLGGRHAVSRLNDDSAPMVLAPEHQREHGRLYAPRFHQHEAVGCSLEVAKDGTMFFGPCASLLLDRSQDQAHVEVCPWNAANPVHPRDSADLLEVKGLPRKVVQEDLLLPTAHSATHRQAPLLSSRSGGPSTAVG